MSHIDWTRRITLKLALKWICLKLWLQVSSLSTLTKGQSEFWVRANNWMWIESNPFIMSSSKVHVNLNTPRDQQTHLILIVQRHSLCLFTINHNKKSQTIIQWAPSGSIECSLRRQHSKFLPFSRGILMARTIDQIPNWNWFACSSKPFDYGYPHHSYSGHPDG